MLLSLPSLTVVDKEEWSATMFVAACKRQTLRAVPGPGKTLPFVIFADLGHKFEG